MNVTKDQWQKIIGIVLGAVIAIAAVLGWVLPLPPATQQAGSQSLGVVRFNQAVQFLMPSTFLGAETHSGIETHSGATTINNLTATTITATTLISQAVGFVGSTATITDVTATYITGTLKTAAQPNVTSLGTLTTITSTNVISMAGATFTGPVKYGTASTYTTGASIVHGFSVTPTICMLWPETLTATLTITATGFSCDIPSTANPVYWLCGK